MGGGGEKKKSAVLGGRRAYFFLEQPLYDWLLGFIVLNATFNNRVHLAGVGFELTTLVLIGTDCIGINPITIRPRRPSTAYM